MDNTCGMNAAHTDAHMTHTLPVYGTHAASELGEERTEAQIDGTAIRRCLVEFWNRWAARVSTAECDDPQV